ncbi:LacI family DNA-binding transcriptional regulator [Olivibacter sp. SDN3]|uniref:LacI family DNA-binding transcriptional regulator n=1 Tax=Olivibacter sp. SDN3 TaxID=2764720 RepID=UPI001651AE2E|nr:LacI family DNA-binding transcriptional regulator [Olivibacter sp. SDN3]QNL50564.1 LacI family DNA-binding transcriptional regulator [Olivibacter sp. SDN3]
MAKQLRLSVSTVSKALNDHPRIGEVTKDRVKKLAKQLNYVPNQAAIHFKQRKTFTLGIILPSLMDHFYTLAVNGFDDYASAKGYHVIIGQNHESLQREKQLVSLMQSSRIDGLLISVSKETQDISHLRKLEQAGIPVIYFARKPIDINCNYIVSNVYDASIKAVSFLLSRGHKRIAFINGPSYWSTSKQRFVGYRDGLIQNGLKFDPTLVDETNLSTESTHKAVRKLMQHPAPPTAILCFKDYMMLDVMKCIRTEYSSMAKSIELIGYGALPLFEKIENPPLASMQEQPYKIGQQAAETILKLIDHPEKERIVQQTSLPCTLKIFQ